MEIKRAYKFRIYPSAKQIGRMRSWRASLRWLWNLALEQHEMGHARPRDERRYPSFFDQNRELTEVRALDSRLDDVPSCCCQQVLRELDLAWKRCFQRITQAPRFKGHRHEEHMRIYAPDVNGWKIRGDELTFRKLGPMRIVVDRPIEGVVSSCSIKLDVDRYFAIILSTITIADPVSSRLPAVGINRGIIHAISDSTGRMVDAPQLLDNELTKIARLSRKLAKTEPRGRNHEKARLKLARKHQKIRNRREWWLHQQSLHYANTAGVIGIEAFDVKAMTSSEPDPNVMMPKSDLNRRILDVAWYELERQITYKAEERGGRAVRVVVPGISRECSKCGTAASEPVSGHGVFHCAACLHTEPGDTNASKNVLVRAVCMPPAAPRVRKSIKIPGRRKSTEKSRQAAGLQPVEDSREVIGANEAGIARP